MEVDFENCGSRQNRNNDFYYNWKRTNEPQAAPKSHISGGRFSLSRQAPC